MAMTLFSRSQKATIGGKLNVRGIVPRGEAREGLMSQGRVEGLMKIC
jgi:hypothetical protein